MTVVVIACNDARRLPRAVRSALEQSLVRVEVIIVDDASTDSTPRVAADLAAAHPDRVRTFPLQVSSGGCGAPRNFGIQIARGRYVMFLDSDDTLPPHACGTMVAAAEETGADLVAGRCVRVLPDREEDWCPWLYREPGVFGGVLDQPDLLDDTLATNKCYRRTFLDRAKLRFAERLHYEHLLFSAQAYLAADGIAVVPDRVYNRLVDPRSRAPSISDRRSEPRDFADRLEIHRRIDIALRDHGAAELARLKDTEFIDHDLLLYLRGLRSRDPGDRRPFTDLARSYLAEMDDAVFHAAGRIPAIAALMIREGDIEAAMAAVDLVPRSGVPVLSMEPAEQDGRVYWSAAHIGTELGRSLLDVTDMDLWMLPPDSLHLGGRVTAMRPEGRLLRVSGTVVNPLGRIGPDEELSGTLDIRDRRRAGRARQIQASFRHLDGRIAWEAMFVPSRTIRPFGLVDQTWAMGLRLKVRGTTVMVRLTSDGTAHCDLAVPVRPRLTRAVGDHLEPYIAGNGELALRIVARRWPARMVLPPLRRAAGTALARALRRRLAQGWQHQTRAHARTLASGPSPAVQRRG
ncbi:glycosyltransferase family 2 protein [Actinomadura mexicana]|uniref:Glycosyltransferase involved in cell wall bisynthesis n=1 Tax=Actinomadura mexicana TaxID=134959 RepID=A0A239H0N5_9ACTN|nr:glycosyltransferase family 2 protein [Actinomadura mexicana]SNS74353.1 Glycosyltransferase involved in cell wall bisynthesis [Actinomadura mexicana]